MHYHRLISAITKCLQLRNHFVSLLNPYNGITNQLVNNSLGRLLLVHNGSCLTHQERSCVIHSIIINVITCRLLDNLPVC